MKVKKSKSEIEGRQRNKALQVVEKEVD